MNNAYSLLAACDVHVSAGDRWRPPTVGKSWSCGTTIGVESDFCTTTPTTPIIGPPVPEVGNYVIEPFTLEGRVNGSLSCLDGQGERLAKRALRNTLNTSLGHAIWKTSNPKLDDATLTAVHPTSIIGALVNGLEAFYRTATVTGVTDATDDYDESPIVLASLDWFYGLVEYLDKNNPGRLLTGERIVTSAGFSKGSMAITGPIDVWLDSVTTFHVETSAKNTQVAVAQQLAAIGFDPCAAIKIQVP